MLRSFSIAIFFGITILLAGCGSYKKTPYFQDISRSREAEQAIRNFSPITVQPSDILSVSVTSLNPLAWPDTTNANLGYTVDEQGEITLPMIGNVKVAGLTTSEISKNIRDDLQTYLKEPSVVVRVLNFKIAVMGDVLRPDVYPVTGERVTVTEALSMAGDLNITANRSDILLIRETDGKRKTIPLNIASGSLLNSPYYYLKNNDVLYVQPGRNKYASVDGSFRFISIGLSALSILAIILTRN